MFATAALEQANFTDQLVTVHLRHAYVSKQQSVVTLLPARQGLTAVLRIVCLITKHIELGRHQLLINQIIFGDQDPWDRRVCIHDTTDQCPVSDTCSAYRDQCGRKFQNHPKGTAHPDFTFDIELAFHQADQLPGNDQSDTRAFDATELSPKPIKRLKQFTELFRGNTHPRIANSDADRATIHRLGNNVDPTALTVVFNRITEQIQKNLFEPYRIGEHLDSTELRQIEIDPDLTFLGQLCYPVDAINQNPFERNGFQRDIGFTCFNSRQVQYLINQRHQMLAGTIDFGGVSKMLLTETSIIGKQLRVPEDCIQRRTQFMAHTRQKIGFRLVRAFCLGHRID